MTSTNFRLMFQSFIAQSLASQSLKSRAWRGRSLSIRTLGLILAASTVASTVAPALAQSQSTTWQNTLARLFGRQQKKGGTREPIPNFCSVSPVRYNAIRSEGARVFNSVPQRLLTDKPLILWYGNNITSIQIRNRSTPSAKPLVIPVVLTKPQEPAKEQTAPSSQQSSYSSPVLNRFQYDGEALLPGQNYELEFIETVEIKPSQAFPSSKKEFEKEVESYRFQTLSQSERDRLNRQLETIAAKAAQTKSDPILAQVEFLLQQNLVNDAHMLIAQQSKPSPELAAAIAAAQSPCDKYLNIKRAEVAPTPSPKPTPSPHGRIRG